MHNRGAKYVVVGKNTSKLDEQDHLVDEILKHDIHANTIIYPFLSSAIVRSLLWELKTNLQEI